MPAKDNVWQIENMELAMKPIIQACIPRPDIIAGSFNPEIFTASLSQVLDAYSGKGTGTDNIYTDARLFFTEATFPTEGLRRVVRDVFGRLSGDNSLPAIHRLETSFGGGKTHTLISLVHLAKRGSSIAEVAKEVIEAQLLLPEGSVDIVGIACDEMPVIEPSGEEVLPYTLWGELALRLGGESFYRENLKEVTSTAFPGKYFLERLFGTRKVLIMMDELAQYATRYEAAHLGGGDQIGAFLMGLLGYARTHSDISVVVTLASQQDAFRQQTGMLAGVLQQTLGRAVDTDEAEALAEKAGKAILSVVSRDATTTVPVRATEISRVLARRLFVSIDHGAAQETAQAYMAMYQKSGAQLPDQASRADFEQVITNNYPFHPSFISFLTNKLSTVQNFQGTRGVLRVLAMAIRSLWKKNTRLALVHTCHIDLANPDVADEVVGRTGASDLITVLNADVGGADSGSLELGASVAQALDTKNPHPLEFPLYEWTWKVVFLHSLVGRGEGLSSNLFGVSYSEALFETAMPDMTPAQVETALKAIADEAYYLRDNEGRFYAHTDPTEARIVSTIKQGISPDAVGEHLAIVSRKVVTHNSPTFVVAQDVSQPEDIPDKTDRPVLAIVRLDANRIDAEAMITSCGGNTPRLHQNYVFLLVPETVQIMGETWNEDRTNKSRYRIERLEDLTRTVLAMRRLDHKPEDFGMTAAKLVESGFKNKLRERELALQTAVSQAYEAIYFPGASGATTKKMIKQAGGEGGQSVDAEILRVLSGEGEMVTMEKATTSEMLILLGQMFFHFSQTPSIEQIRSQLAQNRRWPILEQKNVLDTLLRAGVERGQWCLYRFTSVEDQKPAEFYSRDTGALPMDLNLSQAGWKLVSVQGALQRGWNPQAEPAPEQVEQWVGQSMQLKPHTKVADVLAAVKQQHGDIKDSTILTAIDNAVQKAKLYTYTPTEGNDPVPAGEGTAPDLVYGSNAYFHKTSVDDILITPAEASEYGWVEPEDTRFTAQGKQLAEVLYANLRKLGSMYAKGANTHIDLLRMSGLELPEGGKINIDLVKVSPKEMKLLAELFEVLGDLTKQGSDTQAQIDIHQVPESCAFFDLVKHTNE